MHQAIAPIEDAEWRLKTLAWAPRKKSQNAPILSSQSALRLASRVARLSISVRDPSAFASERSEIAQELRRLAKHQGASDAS
jgi:hypothetical protein